jgi:hypothetical protein
VICLYENCPEDEAGAISFAKRMSALFILRLVRPRATPTAREESLTISLFDCPAVPPRTNFEKLRHLFIPY